MRQSRISAPDSDSLLVLEIPLPILADGQIAGLCGELEAGIAQRLDGEQRRHIGRFGPYAMRAKLARLAARAALLKYLPQECKICGSPPHVAGVPDRAIAISYSPDAAFCAISTGRAQNGLAIDVEPDDGSFPAAAAAGMFSKLGLPVRHAVSSSAVLRLWLAWEIVTKLSLDWRKIFRPELTRRICESRQSRIEDSASGLEIIFVRIPDKLACIGLGKASGFSGIVRIRHSLNDLLST